MKMLLNLVHRPEMAPEYIACQSHGESKAVKNESFEIFKLQQDMAHQAGLKTTIMVTYPSLFEPEVVETIKAHHKKYGDEIGLSLWGMNCPHFNKEFETEEVAFWFLSFEKKKKVVNGAFTRFHDKFGFYPNSVSCYYIDVQSLAYMKSKYPSLKIAVATCFEEGVNVFHGTNNSWYTFLEGGPWAPWIPSKENLYCSASDKTDDLGVVAVPHLTRDMLLSIESRNDFFASHPHGILRAMAYDGQEMPYFYNLTDQWVLQANYNHGFSYYMIFVGPGWMSKAGRWQASYELSVKAYDIALKYLAKLKADGFVEDMTMSAYADWFRDNKKSYKEPTIALWEDVLYGSGRQVFWYLDSQFRVLIDPHQGGAIVDIRPYVAKLDRPVGADTKYLANAMYPYIINSQHRSGFSTHYVGEGSIYSCKVCHKGEEIDLCTCRTKGRYENRENGRKLTLDPVTIEFADGITISLCTKFIFTPEGCIQIEREIVDCNNGDAEITLREYLNGTYGTNEYPEDLRGVKLLIANAEGQTTIDYNYDCKSKTCQYPFELRAIVPQVNTKITLKPVIEADSGTIKEGYLFSPIYKLSLSKTIKKGGKTKVCLKIEKAE